MKCNYTKQIRNAARLCAVGVMSLALFGEAQTASADTYIVAPMADTYLQSDGTQAIDTGYYASPSTKVVIDFEPLSTNSAPIFGSFGSGLPYQFGLTINTGVFSAYVDGGKSFGATNGVVKLSRYTAILDGETKTATVSNAVSSVSVSLGGTNTASNNLPLAVFTRRTAVDKYTAGFSGKIYSMQIYDDGNLVRDFIPFAYGATTGLYDRVNGRVYEKAESNLQDHDFVFGTDDAYVRGSETSPAYVNTGIKPTPATKVEIDFAMMSCTTNTRVFGAISGGSTYISTDLHIDSNPTGKLRYCMHDAGTSGTAMIDVDSIRHVFTLDGKENKALITSENGSITNYNAVITDSHVCEGIGPMVIFGVSNRANPTNGATLACDVKVYSMKIWDDVDGQRTLLRDFTPRMVNGKAGFWDNVNSEFHGTINANDLRYGGAIESDTDPISACTVSPQGGMVRANGTLTLTASATGATGFQWFLDGEMIEGATGSTFDVEWTKDSNLVRRYRCLAFFDAFGYAESAEAVVTNTPAATTIIMR